MLFQLKNGGAVSQIVPAREPAGLPAKGDEFSENIGILFANLEPIAGNVTNRRTAARTRIIQEHN
jgi:hypothetical protein